MAITKEQGALNYLKYYGGDPSKLKLVMIMDNGIAEVAQLIHDAAVKAGGKVYRFNMDDLGPRPDKPTKENPALAFSEDILGAAVNAGNTLFMAGDKPGELESFRWPLIKLVQAEKLVHGHSPGLNLEMLKHGLEADIEAMARFTDEMTQIVEEYGYCKVFTPAGTDLTVSFHPQWNWVQDAGYLKPGHMANIPRGEFFTCPLQVDGKMVADGSVGAPFSCMLKDPVTFMIENSRVVSVECDDNERAMAIWNHMMSRENGNRVGEFAFPSNLWILNMLINALLQDEKAGLHLAFGHTYEDETGADWTSSIHTDYLLRNATVYLGREAYPFLLDGLYPDHFWFEGLPSDAFQVQGGDVAEVCDLEKFPGKKALYFDDDEKPAV